MEGNAAALAELRRLGVPLVPAVAVGDRAVHGWNPEGYARLLGVRYQPEARLPASELAARLDRFLELAGRLVRQIPPEHLDHAIPGRARPVRDLAFHIFRVALAFVDGMDTGRFPESWFQERAPADLTDGAAIARYGALVRGRVQGWFEGAGPRELDRVIDVYYGPQAGHALLERTAWHAAQHLRQLHAMLERLGVTPAAPLPAEDFRGLPLPESLW